MYYIVLHPSFGDCAIGFTTRKEAEQWAAEKELEGHKILSVASPATLEWI